MERPMISKRIEVELERLTFHDFFVRHVVDHKVRKIGLAGNGAKRREFGTGESYEVRLAGLWVGDCFEYCRIRRRGNPARMTELRKPLFLHRRFITQSLGLKQY